MAKLSDKDAKEIMRNCDYWPTCTSTWGVRSPTHFWIRCRPSDSADATEKLPFLRSPGAALFTTQPDGLWAYFTGLQYTDVLAIEVCGSIQNLNDKRSRFNSIGTSLLLTVPVSWLNGDVKRQKGGKMARYKACGTFDGEVLPKQGEVNIPVRFLRVLFAIPDDEYKQWMDNSVPAGHEYFMKHGSLKTATSQDTQKFLAGMSFRSHFRTLK